MYLLHCDPSLCSPNIGDQIISEFVQNSLQIIFPEYAQVKFPTQYSPQFSSHSILKQSSLNIVGGSNLLTGNRLRFSQWKLGKLNLLHQYKFVLFGVGWWKYGNDPDLYTRFIYNRILSKSLPHSVRDQYTVNQLKKCGINSINTSCPTLWPLSSSHLCSKISNSKSSTVLFTLTDYARDKVSDTELLNILADEYDTVYFWPQGTDDFAYFNDLTQSTVHNINVLPFGLPCLKDFLSSHYCDYIGTRLHSGILALNYMHRSIILEVDNRATEIGRDTKIPTCPRNDFQKLRQMINISMNYNIHVPFSAIQTWVHSLRSSLLLQPIPITTSSFKIFSN